MLPLITVIIPSYNHARFLERRMQSILQQTCQDFELIILDDNSTDASRDLVESYRAHPKIRSIVYSEQNSGTPIKQWFKGIELARTDWIYIAESDDTCDPGLFESLLPALSKPGIVLALTEVQYINESGDSLLQFPPLGEGYWHGADFVRQYMLRNCYLCNSGMAIFRRQAVPAVGSWLTDLHYSPDYYFWISLMLQGQVYNNGQRMANFRKHAHEFTHGKYDSLVEHADHARMLWLLWQEKLLTGNDIKQTVLYKLTGLATRRSGMPASDYDAYTKYWQQLAKQCGVQVSASAVGWNAFQRKIRHKLGLRYG